MIRAVVTGIDRGARRIQAEAFARMDDRRKAGTPEAARTICAIRGESSHEPRWGFHAIDNGGERITHD